MSLVLLYSLYFVIVSIHWLYCECKMNNKEESPCVQPVCLSFCFTSSAPDSHEDLLQH